MQRIMLLQASMLKTSVQVRFPALFDAGESLETLCAIVAVKKNIT